ncbi:MAG: hypothetical protein Q8P50_14305, partial [Bacillota bacterium]|nr:hypothetical protein [Bacillota bacterium]
NCYAWIRPTEAALKALSALDDEALHDAEKRISDAQPPAVPAPVMAVLDVRDGRLCVIDERGIEKTVAQLDSDRDAAVQDTDNQALPR